METPLPSRHRFRNDRLELKSENPNTEAFTPKRVEQRTENDDPKPKKSNTEEAWVIFPV